jgi:ATP-dependent RNA helicase DDX56/DBP9
VISTQVGGEDLEQQEGGEEADEDPDAASTSASAGKKRKASDMQASLSSSSKKKKRKNKTTAQTEYGVTRGIDFVDVACVLNFDLPGSARAYTHRVGRTARAGRSGQALSFVVPKSKWGPSHQKGGFDTSLKSAKADEKVWRRIEREQRGNGVGPDQLQEYRFDMTQVEGFRYRMEDGLRSVTRAYVREARIKEIKNEVLNSDKLKAHFEDNPKDLAFLKHDKPLNPARVQKHMKHVPSYLMPRIAPVGGTSTLDNAAQADSSSNAEGTAGGSGNVATGDSKYVPYKKGGGSQRGGKGGRGGRGGRGGKTGGSKRSNPLKSFKRK